MTVTVESSAGTYQPFVYGPPGALALMAPDPFTAIRVGRCVLAMASLTLIGLAIWLLWDPERPSWSLVGLMVAFTPMVVFMAASLNPNGVEIAAGACVAAGVLRLSRGEPIHGGHWVAFATGGILLALSRSLGPVWLALYGLLFLAFAGRRRAWSVLRESGKWAVLAGVVLASACLAGGLWQLEYVGHPQAGDKDVLASLLPAASGLPELLRQSIGVFGSLDVAMPSLVYSAWQALVISLLLLSLLVGSRRQRWILVGGLGSLPTIALLLSVVFMEGGFGVQGRYFLPISIALPLVSAEILRLRGGRLGPLEPRRLIVGIGVTVGLIQLVALYANGRRQAVGTQGPMLYASRALWRPPGGWIVWLGLAVVGVAFLMAAAVVSSSPTEDSGG